MNEVSRKGYDFERALADPQWDGWNASSYKLVCLVAAGRDAMGMDLQYDETGLITPPTPYERRLAITLLERALKEARYWPERSVGRRVRLGEDGQLHETGVVTRDVDCRALSATVLEWCKHHPDETASDELIDEWMRHEVLAK